MAEQHFMRPLMTAQVDLVREAEKNPAKRDACLQGVQDLTFFLHCWVYEACKGTVYAIYHESDTEAKDWPPAFKDVGVNIWPLANICSISWKYIGGPPPQQGAPAPPRLPVPKLETGTQAQAPLATLRQPGARQQSPVPAPQFPYVSIEAMQGRMLDIHGVPPVQYFRGFRARREMEIATQRNAQYVARQNALMYHQSPAYPQPGGRFQNNPAMNTGPGQLQYRLQAQAGPAYPYPPPYLIGRAERGVRYQQADARRRTDSERQLALANGEQSLQYNPQMRS